jgi:hypothetical protein
MEAALPRLFSAVRISFDDRCGRSVVAARDVTAGELILRCAALAAVPHPDRCWCCLSKSPEGLLRCTQCGVVTYCSKSCQAADWRVHRPECRRFPAQGELDALSSDFDVLSNAYLLGRSLRQVLMPAQVNPSVPDTHSPCYFHSRDDLERMTEAGEHDAFAVNVAKLADARALLPLPFPSAASVAVPIARCFPVNNFAITDDLLVGIGAAVCPAGALLNHSCAPNCCVTYKVIRGSPPGTGKPVVLQEFRALRTIRAGEELCHSYIETAQHWRARSKALQQRYGFECKCELCCEDQAEGTGSVSDLLYRPSHEESSSEAEAGTCIALADTCSSADFASHALVRSVAAMRGLNHRRLVQEPGVDDSDGDAGVAAELALVENAIILRKAILPRVHRAVQEAITGALNRYIILSDALAATVAALHSLDFYSAAYRATPHHPILALQAYALGDLASQAAAVARQHQKRTSLANITVRGVVDDSRGHELAKLFDDADRRVVASLICALKGHVGSVDAYASLLRTAAAAYSCAAHSLTISHGPSSTLATGAKNALVALQGKHGTTQLQLDLDVRAASAGAEVAGIVAAGGWRLCESCATTH